MQKSEEAFSEVYNTWELERLYADLTIGGKPLSPNAKTFLRGILCGYSPREIGKELGYQGKDPSSTVRQTLSKEVYPAIEALLNPDQEIDWRTAQAPRLLERYRKNLRSSLTLEIPWKQVCCDVLELQQKQWLTSHPLGAANRRVQDIYVPLGLVERQPKPRVKQDFDPEHWSVQEQEEKIKPVSHQDFFGLMLKGQSPKSKGKRIAIVGEPGAGKTTLLQEIGAKVDGVSIWIDLASLKRDNTLEDYLLQKWLKPSLRVIRRYAPGAVPDLLEPSVELKQAFNELFEQNQVWLLLDGADEMASELGLPLNWVAQQLRQPGWVAQARVVLTSRLNVWSADGDRLVEFDTYRNLDFEPEQVVEFIDKWFAEELNSSQKLKEELERSSDRIKSLIRNPLRLTLLCITWKGVGDRLPETKAGLYQRLVNAHYKWKDDKQEFVIDPDEREQLHQKLGELSKAALDSKESRFRLRQSFIARFLGKSDKRNSLFWWAIKLGWLNQIGLPGADENDADEPVYAFFHPTFQEYFAALAIEDWDDFLPRNHVDKPTSNRKGECKYRIFEPQWKETFLLWINHHEKELSRERGEQIVRELVNFNDGCGSWENIEGVKKGFYQFRAYFLAFEVISSVSDSDQIPLADDIINQVIELSFGYYLDKNRQAYGYWEPISQAARSVLQNSANEKILEIVLEIIQLHQDKSILGQAFQVLGKIGIGKSSAIGSLIEIAQNNKKDEYFRSSAIAALGEISRGCQRVIDTFLLLLDDSTGDDYFRRLVAWNLSKIAQGKKHLSSRQIAIRKLENLCFTQNEEIRKLSAMSLLEIESSNQVAAQTLEQLCDSDDLNVQFESATSLIKFKYHVANRTAIQTLEKLSSASTNEFTQFLSVNALKRIDSSNSIANQAIENLKTNAKSEIMRKRFDWLSKTDEKDDYLIIDELINSIQKTQNSSDVLSFADRLKPVLRLSLQGKQRDIIRKLKIYVNAKECEKDFLKFYACYDVLWHCAQTVNYPEFYQAWNFSSTTDVESFTE